MLHFKLPPSEPSLDGGVLLLPDPVSNWFPCRVNFPGHNSAQASSSSTRNLEGAPSKLRLFGWGVTGEGTVPYNRAYAPFGGPMSRRQLRTATSLGRRRTRRRGCMISCSANLASRREAGWCPIRLVWPLLT